jgi:hypothetical protein
VMNFDVALIRKTFLPSCHQKHQIRYVHSNTLFVHGILFFGYRKWLQHPSLVEKWVDIVLLLEWLNCKLDCIIVCTVFSSYVFSIFLLSLVYVILFGKVSWRTLGWVTGISCA